MLPFILINSFAKVKPRCIYGGKELIFHFATRNQIAKRIKTKSGKTGWINISSEDQED